MTRPSMQWATSNAGSMGNALGYGTHGTMLRKYAEQFIDIKDDSPIAFHLTPAERFFYIKNKVNILFTMWEFHELPNVYIANLNRADVIIVPCQFCKDLFAQYTDKPIYICREGVVPEDFPFYQRSSNPKKFRFLWSGAPNQRKGYPFVITAVDHFKKYKNVEIYIKTTSKDLSEDILRENTRKINDAMYRKDREEAIDRIVERIPKMEKYADSLNVLGDAGNVFYDTRKLSLSELRELYNSASCFLMPSFGEGWGLTLCEAMATGAPCIATPITGMKDYFDEQVGFGCKYNQAELDIRFNYGIKTMSFIPDTTDFIVKMYLVMNNYEEALRRGRKASERIHRKFTWEISAKRLRDIIEEIEVKYANRLGKLETVSRA